jgi:PAS domain S-box-containing protein
MYNGMSWLLGGIVYSLVYAVAGFLLRDAPTAESWFRAGALMVPPMTGAILIVRKRNTWTGCQWLFWSTIALGLTMSGIGLSGWATHEGFSGERSWLAWPAVFALFGNVAPLYALLAQPHRGPRERLAASTAVDIAGLAVVTGFLYSFFVTGSSASPEGGGASAPLLVVSGLQAGLVAAGLVTAACVARRTAWGMTYRRLGLGAVVNFAMLTLCNIEIGQLDYRSALADLTWLLPFAFFPWAVAGSPASSDASESADATSEEGVRPRPWVIFIAVALLPVIDFALRRTAPAESFGLFRDLSSAVAIVSVLPLLVARIAVERAEMQQASDTTRLLAAVIEQAQDAILVLTKDGRFRHANQAFCRATGFSRDELRAMGTQELLPGDALPAQNLARAGAVWRGTVTRTRRDGTAFPAAASIASIVVDRNGPCLVSVERDISEERRLREQLIHTERLSAVGQLVAGVAHELNNPLQTVIGLTDLLVETESNATIRHDLSQISASGQRAARIVQSLLAFVRRSASERSMADLNELVRSTLELRAYEIRRERIVLHEAYAEPAPLVVVNPEEIRQVILNMVLNAEQAIGTRSAPGAIQVRTGATTEIAFVEIADDGPGVPSELKGQIFEPFFTTKDVGSGTGLGLSISLGIAEAHGGSLTLRRAERGACFRLTLPSLPRSVQDEVSSEFDQIMPGSRATLPGQASSASE